MAQIFNFESHRYFLYKGSNQVYTDDTNEMLNFMKTGNYTYDKTYNMIEGFPGKIVNLATDPYGSTVMANKSNTYIDFNIGEYPIRLSTMSRIHTEPDHFSIRTHSNAVMINIVKNSIDYYYSIINTTMIKDLIDDGTLPSTFIGNNTNSGYFSTSNAYDYLVNSTVLLTNATKDEDNNYNLLISKMLSMSEEHLAYKYKMHNQFIQWVKTNILNGVLTKKVINHSNNKTPINILVGMLTRYITYYQDNSTKTYTNSTWSTKKTWYIKVTFKCKTYNVDSNTSNVVNYETSMLR